MKYVLMIFLLFAGFNLFSQCENNSINCKGQCSNYIDENEDGYCDFSTIEKESKTDTTNKSKNTIKKIKQNNIKHKKCPETISINNNQKTTSENKDTTLIKDTNIIIVKDLNTDINNVKPIGSTAPYNLLSIIIIVLLLYLATFFLHKAHKIKKTTHTRIWNSILLISFLLAGLSGLVIAAKIIYGLELSFLRKLYIYHVNFGIAMAVVSITHVLWHWKFFYKIFTKKK